MSTKFAHVFFDLVHQHSLSNVRQSIIKPTLPYLYIMQPDLPDNEDEQQTSKGKVQSNQLPLVDGQVQRYPIPSELPTITFPVSSSNTMVK